MDNAKVDNYFISGQNEDNNGDNENNGGYTVIKPEDIKQLNDPNCKHLNMRRDDTDTIGDTVAWVCSDCGRGAFLPKSITKIT
jgi:hypothetical protein